MMRETFCSSSVMFPFWIRDNACEDRGSDREARKAPNGGERGEGPEGRDGEQRQLCVVVVRFFYVLKPKKSECFLSRRTKRDKETKIKSTHRRQERERRDDL